MNQIFRMGDSIDFHSPAVHMNVRLLGEAVPFPPLAGFLDDLRRLASDSTT